MNGNERKPGNEETISACLDISDLDRQVRMISDSLVACKMMSSFRPTVKKEHDTGMQTVVRPNIISQTPIEILLPPEERTLEYFSQNKMENMMVSYVTSGSPDFKFVMEEEPLSAESGCVVFKEGSICSWEEGVMHRDGGSRVGMYRYEKVDPARMVEVIQRELKALMELAPTAALIVSGLSDNFFHFKDCIKCREKIRPALPWILNRIQKLRKYVTTKNHGTYLWPNDYSYLRLAPEKPTEQDPPKIVELEEPKTQIAKLEKIDAFVVFDDRPGIQILLDVKPEKGKKRFFDKFKIQKVSRRVVDSFPTLHLREPSSGPLIQILRPSPEIPVAWSHKQEITRARGFAVAVPAVFLTPRPRTVESELVSVPGATAITVQIAKSQIYPKPVQFCEERALKVIQNPLTILVQQTPRKKEPEKKLRNRDFRANASGLVRELLDEAEEEKMQVQKVKELESEVKGLKDLMLEVHKNQVELSKVLLEKGVCSTPIIKLTDPNMLEEESQVVRRAAQVEVLGTRTSSVEALQFMVDDLRRKCDVKNRMLVTLLKGLRSDVPKEWWEELVDYIFDESKPVEAFDPEKVSEFVQQTSLFLLGGEKESSARSRYEEQPSEDKSRMKSATGEESEDVQCSVEKDGVRILASNPTSSDTNKKTELRKLESQILALNAENDMLWEQVKQLKEALVDSMTEVKSRGSYHKPDMAKATGRTINLTIQIADKDSHKNITASRSQISTTDTSPRLSIRLVNDERHHSKPNHLKDETYPESKTDPRPSSQTRMSSKHSSRPGSSSDLRSPSVMELVKKQNLETFALIANERELQTIPESDIADWVPSVKQSRHSPFQKLRKRLKSMNKDMEVLKSKNDRIDRLLDRIVDDAIENSESYEKLENDFRNFENRLQ